MIYRALSKTNLKINIYKFMEYEISNIVFNLTIFFISNSYFSEEKKWWQYFSNFTITFNL